MKVTEYIAYTIDRLPKGYVFTYEDFIVEVNKKEAVIKALNRMAESGSISKLSKGRYYKPEKTPFGEILPEPEQLVKDLLEEDGKTIGYLTGYSIYNKLGLTSQVSHLIQIGKNEVRPKLKRNYYTISFVRQKNTINRQNIPLLQILDALRYIKKIPDTSIEKALIRFKSILDEMTKGDLERMIRLAMKYSPGTRALLGALLDELGMNHLTEALLNSLNPITRYKYPGAEKALSTAQKWNIT